MNSLHDINLNSEMSNQKCRECHIVYPFDCNKLCSVCVASNLYDEITKHEFVYLFNCVKNGIEGDYKKYKFLWKQSMAISDRQAKICIAENSILVIKFHEQLKMRLDVISTLKKMCSLHTVELCQKIFNSIDLLLFYFHDQVEIGNGTITNMESLVYKMITKTHRLRRILCDSERVYTLFKAYISSQVLRDFVYCVSC